MSDSSKRCLRCRCGQRKARVYVCFNTYFIWCPDCKQKLDSPGFWNPEERFRVRDALVKSWKTKQLKHRGNENE